LAMIYSEKQLGLHKSMRERLAGSTKKLVSYPSFAVEQVLLTILK